MTDDSISRKSVIAAFQSITGMKWERLKILLPVLAIVEEVPSVGPQITLESAIDFLHSIGWMQEHDRILTEFAERRGRWIDEPIYKQTIDGKTWDGYTYCSECREMHEYGHRSNYCDNCGAEMRKSKEGKI